jgi:hypothetical protein
LIGFIARLRLCDIVRAQVQEKRLDFVDRETLLDQSAMQIIEGAIEYFFFLGDLDLLGDQLGKD